jgi:hypothetical protein
LNRFFRRLRQRDNQERQYNKSRGSTNTNKVEGNDSVRLAENKQPLICPAFGTLICADQRNCVSANQRFLLPGKTAQIKPNDYRVEDSAEERRRELVRMRGLEPPQDCSYSVLSAARLPFRHIRMSIDCDSIEAKIY